TKAGRALAKHGSRPGSAFLSTLGKSVPEINKEAQEIVEDILTHPGSTFDAYQHSRYGDIIEVIAPDGRGLRYNARGTFIGFLEP
ncbi:MAG: hypothetical protein M3Y74_10670, partial [Chloroflexota bacterium]|nr:hypothetical protein [Chloroflexota bacterium]